MKGKTKASRKEFQRSPLDDLVFIQSSASINTSGLAIYEDRKDFAGVRSFADTMKTSFGKLEGRMTPLLLSNDVLLTEWAARLDLARKNFEKIERNLEKNRHLFFWHEVLAAMGMLMALKRGAEETLELNT